MGRAAKADLYLFQAMIVMPLFLAYCRASRLKLNFGSVENALPGGGLPRS